MKTWEAVAREHLRTILRSALESVTPQVFMRNTATFLPGEIHVGRARYVLRRPRVAAIGKAAMGMAVHASRAGPFEEAILITPRGLTNEAPDGFDLVESDHPRPTEASVVAGDRLLTLAQATGPDETLLLLVSGGSSALVERPVVPLADLACVNDLMLRGGCDIAETNAVRKHLSLVKGGRLAAACRGRVVALYLSDVTQDDVSVIGSGLVSPDETTYEDAAGVLRRHGLWEVSPASVRDHLDAGMARKLPETPKPGLPLFSRVSHHVLAGNATALRRAHDVAFSIGYNALALDEGLRGDASEAGRSLAILARDAIEGTLRVQAPCAIVLGGETTVRVRGRGRGGRNQEVALAAVEGLSGLQVVLGTLATDGVDGPTDAAGAVVDGYTYARAKEAGVDPAAHLVENDAYPFFDALTDLIRTGPTGTNVRDLAVILVGRRDA